MKTCDKTPWRGHLRIFGAVRRLSLGAGNAVHQAHPALRVSEKAVVLWVTYTMYPHGCRLDSRTVVVTPPHRRAMDSRLPLDLATLIQTVGYLGIFLIVFADS